MSRFAYVDNSDPYSEKNPERCPRHQEPSDRERQQFMDDYPEAYKEFRPATTQTRGRKR